MTQLRSQETRVSVPPTSVSPWVPGPFVHSVRQMQRASGWDRVSEGKQRLMTEQNSGWGS